MFFYLRTNNNISLPVPTPTPIATSQFSTGTGEELKYLYAKIYYLIQAVHVKYLNMGLNRNI